MNDRVRRPFPGFEGALARARAAADLGGYSPLVAARSVYEATFGMNAAQGFLVFRAHVALRALGDVAYMHPEQASGTGAAF